MVSHGPKNIHPPGNRRRSNRFDIVWLADLTIPGDGDVRIAAEVGCCAAAGYRVGLIHAETRQRPARIAPEVAACIHNNAIELIDPASQAETDLLIVHGPEEQLLLRTQFQRLSARRTVLVADMNLNGDPSAIEQRFEELFGSLSWAPTSPWSRDHLRRHGATSAIAPRDWRAVVGVRAGGSKRRKRALGWILGSEPDARSMATRDYPFLESAAYDVFLLGGRSREGDADLGLEYGHIAIDRYLNKVDVVAVFPSPGNIALPLAIIAKALAAAKPVVLPRYLSEIVGPGPVYCDPGDAGRVIERILARPARLRAAGAAAKAVAARRFSKSLFLARIARAGKTDKAKTAPKRRRAVQPKRARADKAAVRRALFIATGENDFGAVMRLLAIAGQMRREVEPVFVVFGRHADVIEQFGYRCECLSPVGLSWPDTGAWERWCAIDVDWWIDAYGAKLVVFDGPLPPAELLHSVAARGDCKCSWIRAGASDYERPTYASAAKYFDVVLDLSEPNGSADRRRGDLLTVDPILLFEPDELLPRAVAAEAVGLDEAAPAVLIDLDAEDPFSRAILKDLVREAGELPGVQLAISERSLAAGGLGVFSATTIEGQPIGQLHRAFDFCVSDAGYGTFCERIAHGMPTIFVADRASADGRFERAAFAQESGLALHLESGNVTELPQMLQVLMSDKARAYLQERCAAFDRRNGAADAAATLDALIMPERSRP